MSKRQFAVIVVLLLVLIGLETYHVTIQHTWVRRGILQLNTNDLETLGKANDVESDTEAIKGHFDIP